MVQIQPKRNLPTWIHAPWSLAILLVVTCALFWNVVVMAIKSAETKAKRDQAEERLAELTKQQASLEEALNASEYSGRHRNSIEGPFACCKGR
jgi:hypothetical protein